MHLLISTTILLRTFATDVAQLIVFVEIPERLDNCREHEEVLWLQIMAQLGIESAPEWVWLLRPANDSAVSVKPGL